MQVSLLEGAKAKLEMQVQCIKKEHRRELQSREDELEDCRAAAAKKVKNTKNSIQQSYTV